MTEFNGPVQVYLVAPALTSWGLSRLLRTAAPNLAIMGCAHSLADAIDDVERDLPDVVLFDFDDADGKMDAVRQMHQRTRVRMIALTFEHSELVLQELLAAGACAVLNKHAAPSELLRLVFGVCTERGMTAATPGPSVEAPAAPARRGRPAQSEQASLAGLTPRERETVAALTADPAAPVKVVADRLNVSEHTLRNHLTAIYAKLGVSGRLHLHAYATSGFAPLR